MIARLFVLGALRQGPMHGYLVRQEAVVDQTEAWADVKPGSIYHALHRMQREGLVDAVATEQEGGPARTVYGLTSEGRTALHQQTRRALKMAAIQADPFDVALRLADELDAADRERILGERRDGLAQRLRAHESALRDARPHLTGWELAAFEHVNARLRFELDWLKRLTADDDTADGVRR